MAKNIAFFRNVLLRYGRVPIKQGRLLKPHFFGTFHYALAEDPVKRCRRGKDIAAMDGASAVCFSELLALIRIEVYQPCQFPVLKFFSLGLFAVVGHRRCYQCVIGVCSYLENFWTENERVNSSQTLIWFSLL